MVLIPNQLPCECKLKKKMGRNIKDKNLMLNYVSQKGPDQADPSSVAFDSIRVLGSKIHFISVI